MASKKQIEANRENGLKGGTKSPEKSCLNSLKHGILSKEMIIKNIDSEEDEKELQILQDNIRNNPKLAIRDAVLDVFVYAYWKLRRIKNVEFAEVWQDIQAKRMEILQEQEAVAEKMFMSPEDYYYLTRFSNFQYLINLYRCMEHTKEYIQTKEDINLVCVKCGYDPIDQIYRNYYKTDRAEEANEIADYKLDDSHRLQKIKKEQEILWKDIELTAKKFDEEFPYLYGSQYIPSEFVLDRLMRYEASAENQMYRAINQFIELDKEK
jgi:hypothetical protein